MPFTLMRYAACRRVQNRLWEYAKGALPREETARIDDHVAGCQACASRLRAARKAAGLVATARDLAISDTIGSWAALRTRLEDGATPGAAASARTGRSIPRHWLWTGGLAAAAGVAALAALLIGIQSPRLHHGSSIGREFAAGRNSGAPQRFRRSGSPENYALRHEPLPSWLGPASNGAHGSVSRAMASPAPHGQSTSPARPVEPLPHPAAPEQDDLIALNAGTGSALYRWTAWAPDEVAALKQRIDDTLRKSGKGDDFVSVPFPQIASTDRRALQAAAEEYRQQKEIVDTRLSRDVTVAEKAVALSDLCRELSTRTGIDIGADRSVADEKVTIFCEDQPLREVMRQINRLFGFAWARSGEDGAYRYDLIQDLRGRLTEEEMRNHDLHEALLALDEAMQKRLQANNQQHDWRWAGEQAYAMLSPGDRAALVNGDTVMLTMDNANPDRRLSANDRVPLLRALDLYQTSMNGQRIVSGGHFKEGDKQIADVPDANPTIGLSVDRSEAGLLSLHVWYGATLSGPGAAPGSWNSSPSEALANGMSPAVAHPDNAGREHALRADPLFRRIISLHPDSSCPVYVRGARARPEERAGAGGLELEDHDGPHLFTWDVWEALHKETGVPIIADAYSHYFPMAAVTMDKVTLFDALYKAADAMDVWWKKDGSFIECRSTTFVWDKIKEVPNRYITRWEQDARRNGYLPVEDFLEMSTLSDTQLDSTIVGKAMEHCHGLRDWSIMGKGLTKTGIVPEQLRPYVRFAASLAPSERTQAMTEEGISAGTLRPAQQQALMKLAGRSLSPAEFAKVRFHFEYVPAGFYTWRPLVKHADYERAMRWPLVCEKTPEAALAAARKLYPSAEASQVAPSRGEFSAIVFYPDGTILEQGKLISFPIE